MFFFDINHWTGSDEYYLSSSLYTEEEKEKGIDKIRKRLEDHGLKKAILTSRLAVLYDWDTGNKKLLKTGLSEALHEVFYSFVITPDACFTYDLDQYVQEAFHQKVRLFRVFPKRQLFYLHDRYMKKIFEVFSEARFPVMLDLKQLDITGNKYFDIDVLEKVLEQNKEMPLILETSLKQCMFNRFYFPLLESYENLYLEISGLLLYDQIEHYVTRYGSERLLFGSNHPSLPILVNTGRLLLSEISEKDKNNICYGNIERLIGGIRIG